jgi:hypothetical protein
MAFQSGPQAVYTCGAGNLAANLLVKMAGDGTAIVNTATATDLPVGVTYQAGLIGASVPVCGIGYGIMSIMATAAAIAENGLVYAAAGGMVTATAGGRLIGFAKTATAGSTVIDVIPLACLLTAAALAASATVSIFMSDGTTFTVGSVATRTLLLADTAFTTGSTLNQNFETLALMTQQLAAEVLDIRTKIVTAKVLQ